MLTRRQFRLNVSSACRHANSYKLLINYSNDVTETDSANSFGAPSPTTRLSWRKHGTNIFSANISLGSLNDLPYGAKYDPDQPGNYLLIVWHECQSVYQIV